MKFKAFMLIFAFGIVLSPSSQGQVGNLLKNKLNRAVNAGSRTLNKELNKEIDTAVEKGVLDARDKAATRVEENQQNNSDQSEIDEGNEVGSQEDRAQSGADFSRLFGNKVDLKYKDEYGFSSRIYMVSEAYDDENVVKMDFFMYYSSASPTIGVETKTLSDESGDATPVSAVMVMDGENNSFLVLTNINGMKMGMISVIPDEDAVLSETEGKKGKKITPPTFTKTGNTRDIAGYKCDEYAYVDTDDKTTGKVWFTKDSKLKIDKRGWKNSGMDIYYGNADFNEGIILASESYDDKGKLESKSETKEINPDFPHSISVSGYTLRQMNIGQEQQK